MNSLIVSSPKAITLIGGAQVSQSILSEALKYGENVVCADGGADTALWACLNPVAVIGDMDSASEAAKDAYGDVLHPIPEQNSTDFDKCLRNIEAPLIIGVGFLGDRVDHMLACLHVLLKYRDKPVVLLGDHDVVFIAPSHIRLTLPVGSRLSLMPLPGARVDTRGLRWEVKDGAMSLTQFIGTSNEVAAPVVELRAMGGLGVILPPEALGAVIDALTDAARGQ